ncbi:MAG: beta strand repeat-containing protein, partial [Prosthecobacter sp.]
SGTLPVGLSLNTTTGAVTGTPTSTATRTFTITATDANSCTGSATFTITPVCPAITVNPTSFANGTLGIAYSQTITATGGTAPHSFTVTSGTLPAGLTLTTAGVLSGTPTASNGAGTSLTITATDANGCTGNRPYTLKICPVISLGAITTTGTVGAAFSQTITATGGATPYTFAITSGSIPAGLTLNTSTGAITGTPSAPNSGTIIVTATDVNGCPASRSYTFGITCPAITVTPSTLPVGLAGTAYPTTNFTATGGTAPHTFAITSGTLPPGMTFTSAGVLSGTPTAGNGAGSALTITVTDAFGCTGTRVVTLKVCPVISLPAISTAPVVGTAYNNGVAATGGVSPYTYAITSGTLPTGLSFNTTTGAITGTATNTTATNFTITATDANACTGSRAYTLAPVCPTITVNPAIVAVGTVGVAYSQTISATGGNAPYNFTLTSGTLPAGLTLTASTGVIAGTPTAANGAGVSLTFTATDTYGCTGTRTVTLKVCPVLAVGTITTSATVGTAFSQTINTTGGVSPYTYAVTTGTLPAGLTLSSGGVLSGTPSSTTSQTFTVTATDANGCPGTRSYTIAPVCPTITVNPITLPPGTVGTAYSQSFSGSGGTSPYSFTLTTGTLPAGLTLSSTGVLSGTPTTSNGAGVSITVTGTDAYGCSGTRTVSIKICPVISLAAITSSATVGTAYSQTATASGGTAPYTYAVTTGTLPSGLTLNTTTGAITGKPTNATAQTFTITATDANACPGTRSYTITPTCPTITVNPTSLSNGTVGIAYSQTASATGGTAPYTYSISAGTLPAGLTLNSTSGVISGTPTTSNGAGTSITITATDSLGCTGSRPLNLKICPVVTLGTFTTTGTVGTAYSQTVTASGGATPYTFAVTSGTLPGGLTLNASTGVISGTPNVEISSTVTITATDANGCPGTRSYTLAMSCPPITVNPASVPAGLVGTAYTSTTFTASGGTAPYQYTVVAGTLPAGLTLTTAGVLSGTPTASNGAGVSITVQARDAFNCLGTRAYTIKICPVISLAAISGTAVTGTAYSSAATASGGASPYVYAVTSGALPAGLSLNTSTGAITGTPTATTTANFTITATDANACSGSRAYSLTPTCPTITVSPTSIANATIGIAYSQTMSASGGTAPYSYTLTSGTLPAGLTLGAGGIISGTPTATNGAGVSVTVRATDLYGCTGSQVVLVKVCPVMNIGPTNLPHGYVGSAYSQLVSVTGGATPYSLVQSGGTLPPGLSFAGCNNPVAGPGTAYSSIFAPAANATVNPPDGLITMTFGGTAGPVTSGIWNLRATGGVSVSILGIGLTESGSRTELTGSALKFGVSNNSSSLLGMLGTGTSISSTWEAVAQFNTPGSPVQLKPGIRYAVSFDVDGQNGFLESGLGFVPTFTVELLDGAGNAMASTSSGTLINVLGLFGTGVKSGTTTLHFDIPYGVSPGACSLRFRASAALNTTILGLGTTFATVTNLRMTEAVNASTDCGAITGTPTTAGYYTIQVTATDANGCSVQQPVNIRICPVINLAALNTTLTVGSAYTSSAAASAGTAPYVYALSSGTLPAGLSLNTSTGDVTGTPTSTTSRTFTITATDANGCVGSRSYTLAPVCPAITVSPTTLTNGTLGIAYSQTLSASNGSTPYTWTTTSGTWPAGLSLSSGGVVSGTPTASNGVGVSVTVRATDLYGCFKDQAVSIKICPVLGMSPSSLINGTVGSAYSQTIAGSGGATPYTYSVISGSLPAGLTLNASTGAITGTPTSSAGPTFTISATDANACPGTRSYTLAPVCPTITVSPTSLPDGMATLPYSQ